MKKTVGILSTFLALAVVLALMPAMAQQAETPRAKLWTTEDLVTAETASQFQVSPDGRWAVWVKSTADKEKDGRVSNLMLSSLTERKEIQLTRGTENHSRPRWSPNGELVAFLSSRPRPDSKPEQARMQLWLINPFGGEPWHVTEFIRGIRGFEWVSNDAVVFAAEEDPTYYERELKRKKDASIVVEDAVHTPPVRLFRLSIKDKKVTRLTENRDWIQNWAVSRDGTRAVATHHQSLAWQWDQKIPPKVMLHDLASGTSRQIFEGQRIVPSALAWTRDGAGFYVAAPFSNHPQFLNGTITLIHYYNVAAGSAVQVDLDWANGLGGNFEVTDNGFVALLADGARYRLARYVREGRDWRRTLIEGEHARNIGSFALGEDGRSFVYEYSTASRNPQWYRATLRTGDIQAPTQFTDLNPGWKEKTFARTEVIRWRGANDDEVEGILYYPHNYEAGKRYPLVLAIHGGPTGYDMDQWNDRISYPNNLFAQRGAFVLMPNYHGSGNYGLEWVESICCGKYYDLEVPDMERGVDHLVAQGMVDPERVGTMGWSNGAILSTALSVANPERYKVVSAGAGDVEWISDWANVDFGHAFDSYYFGASPLEDPELYIRKSPFFQMDKVRAPTLIFFGTEDRNVPTSQGWSHYRALYHLDQVPVRFILFPGEPHGLRKLTHQQRKLDEEMLWFDRYLFKTEPPANFAFKSDSPLGMAFRRKSIQRVGTNYGVAHRAAGRRAELLVPEVVRRGPIELGRFEVTRAQFAAFDRNYRVAPGTENYPANGITFEQAQAYVSWLSQQTGQTWRLPRAAEVESFYRDSADENTLDYWAGYALTPIDAERLEEKIRELGEGAPLLKPVGSFRGRGRDDEELLFDLGGNVAEWALDAQGRPTTLGGSADRPADSKARPRAASPAYTGFRVVRESRP